MLSVGSVAICCRLIVQLCGVIWLCSNMVSVGCVAIWCWLCSYMVSVVQLYDIG